MVPGFLASVWTAHRSVIPSSKSIGRQSGRPKRRTVAVERIAGTEGPPSLGVAVIFLASNLRAVGTAHLESGGGGESTDYGAMNIHLFEDDNVGHLSPITDARPAYAISCGGTCLVEVAVHHGNTSTSIREWLSELQEHEFPQLRPYDSPAEWLLNARIAPRFDLFTMLRKEAQTVAKQGVAHGRCAWMVGDRLAAAYLPHPVDPPVDYEQTSISQWLRENKIRALPAGDSLSLMEYPHDVIRYHERNLNDNLAWRIDRLKFPEVAEGVFVAPDVSLPQYWSCRTTDGPILIESGCNIGPFTVLDGPVHVGKNSRLSEFATLKHFVTLGHTSKLGGEVEFSIMEPYSNKQHYGFLGHTYVGSWVNLGAGTCNSDLKNTYGKVRMVYDDKKVDTGMQFMGCVLGDFSKSAIQTSIFTGKTVGVASMLYGVVSDNVPSFVNYAASLGSVTEIGPTVIASMHRRMLARRGVEQLPYHLALIENLFDSSRTHRRGMENKPPSF